VLVTPGSSTEAIQGAPNAAQEIQVYTDEYKARFWAKATIVDDADSCWLWHASTDRDGYGRVGFAGKTTGSHRVAYEMLVGQSPHGLLLLHSCDVPNCVRPSHLTPGTNADNHADKAAKNRSTIGTRNPMVKLRVNEVQAIRTLAAEGVPGKKLALIFGVHPSSISGILTGAKWSKVA
jgi:hypothetical protein